MPPKGSKAAKNKSHPYKEATRHSTRRPKPSTRYADSGNDNVETPEDVQVIPLQNDTQANNIPQAHTHDRDTVQQQPSTSTNQTNHTVPTQVPGPSVITSQPSQSQIQQPVTRQEFDQLRGTMSSIRDMFNNFMASYVPPSTPPTQTGGSGSLSTSNASNVFQQPASLPVSSVIINQPGPSVSVDPNLPGPSGLSSQTQGAASSVLEQAVAAHIRSISEGQATGKTPSDKVSHQLDRKIPQSVVQDIWDNKYVDLELLIDNNEDPEAPMVFKAVNTNEYGQILQVVKPKKPKGITNISQWSYAFDIYISLYTRKYYHETHNLLTYSNKVKQVHSKGGDFIKYDEEFRKSRAKYGIPWETPDLELLVECNQAGLQNQIINIINSLNKTTNVNLPFPASPFPATLPSDKPDLPKPRHPSGACYNFHNTGRCGRVRCNFSHLCYNTGCGQEHPVFKCSNTPSSSARPSPYPGPGARPSDGRGPGSSPNTNLSK